SEDRAQSLPRREGRWGNNPKKRLGVVVSPRSLVDFWGKAFVHHTPRPVLPWTYVCASGSNTGKYHGVPVPAVLHSSPTSISFPTTHPPPGGVMPLLHSLSHRTCTRQPGRNHPRRGALRLEVLEDRNLPSTFTVNNLSDDLVGSDQAGSL